MLALSVEPRIRPLPFLQSGKTPPKIEDTKQRPVVRVHFSGLAECGVSLHGHFSQVHSNLE